MKTDDVLLVISTFPEVEGAARIAEQLVTERLVACANILPGVRSIYRWKEVVEEASETAVIFKTTRSRWVELQQKLRELHPYEVPEIVALNVADGFPAYLQWVGESCAT